MEKENKLFEQMLRALIPTFIEGNKGGGGRWPMPVFESSLFVGYFDASIIVENFLKITDDLLSRGKSISDIAKLYKYPSRIARLAHTFHSRSLWNIDIERQKTFAFRIAEMMDCLYTKNAFNKDNKNYLYSEKEIKNLVDNNIFLTGDIISQVKKTSSLLWLVSESYSPRYPNIFFEFSGEYINDDNNFVVKDYHNLKPEYLTFDLPYDFSDIKIVEKYNTPVDFKVDLMCRSLDSNQNIPNPDAILLLVDGVSITDVNEILEINKKLLLALQESTKYLNSLSRDQVIIWNATIDLYAFIYPLIGKDCFKLLPENFLDEINEEDFKNKYDKAVAWLISIPKNEEGWTTIFDPRQPVKI